MMFRRSLVTAPVALATARAFGAEPAGGRLAFTITRKGSEIGSHTLDFRKAGTVLTVAIDVKIAVSFGPITLYRYAMSGVETYRDDKFAELETTSNDDGTALHVTAVRSAAGVVIDSKTLGKQTLPAETLPLTHWNIGNMTAPLFNPQDGKPMKLAARNLGADNVALADGRKVAATHFALTGESTLDDWYDAANVWTALRAVGTDGSIIDYRRST
jgi:hypothetical protein